MSQRTHWLRISSIVTLLFAVGHTLGGRRNWSPVGQSDVLTAMSTFHFKVEGVSRSYLDFYRGFGIALGVFLLLEAILLWQLSLIAHSSPGVARSFATTMAVAALANAVITWLYILPLPGVFAFAQTACLTIAVMTLR